MIVAREIDGVLYKAEFKGMAYTYKLQNILNAKHSYSYITELLFNEILVSPDIRIDDFETFDALEKVRSFLLEVALGHTEKPISKSKLRQQVDDEWACWGLVFNDISPLDYNTVFYQMTPNEISKANIALSRVAKAIKSKIK